MSSSSHTVYVCDRHVQLDSGNNNDRTGESATSGESSDVARREDGVADGLSHPTNRRTVGRQNDSTIAEANHEGSEGRESATAAQVVSNYPSTTVARREDEAADGFGCSANRRTVGPSEDDTSDTTASTAECAPSRSQRSEDQGDGTSTTQTNDAASDPGEELLKKMIAQMHAAQVDILEKERIHPNTSKSEDMAESDGAASALAAADLQASATAEQLLASYRRGQQAPPTELVQIQAKYQCSTEKAKEIFLDREMRKAATAGREVLNRDGVKGQYSIGKDHFWGDQELKFAMPFPKGRKKSSKVNEVFLRLRYTLVERMIDLTKGCPRAEGFTPEPEGCRKCNCLGMGKHESDCPYKRLSRTAGFCGHCWCVLICTGAFRRHMHEFRGTACESSEMNYRHHAFREDRVIKLRQCRGCTFQSHIPAMLQLHEVICAKQQLVFGQRQPVVLPPLHKWHFTGTQLRPDYDVIEAANEMMREVHCYLRAIPFTLTFNFRQTLAESRAVTQRDLGLPEPSQIDEAGPGRSWRLYIMACINPMYWTRYKDTWMLEWFDARHRFVNQVGGDIDTLRAWACQLGELGEPTFWAMLAQDALQQANISQSFETLAPASVQSPVIETTPSGSSEADAPAITSAQAEEQNGPEADCNVPLVSSMNSASTTASNTPVEASSKWPTVERAVASLKRHERTASNLQDETIDGHEADSSLTTLVNVKPQVRVQRLPQEVQPTAKPPGATAAPLSDAVSNSYASARGVLRSPERPSVLVGRARIKAELKKLQEACGLLKGGTSEPSITKTAEAPAAEPVKDPNDWEATQVSYPEPPAYTASLAAQQMDSDIEEIAVLTHQEAQGRERQRHIEVIKARNAAEKREKAERERAERRKAAEKRQRKKAAAEPELFKPDNLPRPSSGGELSPLEEIARRVQAKRDGTWDAKAEALRTKPKSTNAQPLSATSSAPRKPETCKSTKVKKAEVSSSRAHKERNEKRSKTEGQAAKHRSSKPQSSDASKASSTKPPSAIKTRDTQRSTSRSRDSSSAKRTCRRTSESSNEHESGATSHSTAKVRTTPKESSHRADVVIAAADSAKTNTHSNNSQQAETVTAVSVELSNSEMTNPPLAEASMLNSERETVMAAGLTGLGAVITNRSGRHMGYRQIYGPLVEGPGEVSYEGTYHCKVFGFEIGKVAELPPRNSYLPISMHVTRYADRPDCRQPFGTWLFNKDVSEVDELEIRHSAGLTYVRTCTERDLRADS